LLTAASIYRCTFVTCHSIVTGRAAVREGLLTPEVIGSTRHIGDIGRPLIVALK